MAYVHKEEIDALKRKFGNQYLEQSEQVIAIFRYFDTDCNGYIDNAEAERIGRMLGFEIKDDDDTSWKGVSLPQMLRQAIAELKRKNDNLPTAINTFCKMNCNGKGIITKKKLEAFLIRVGLEIPDEMINELFWLSNKKMEEEDGVHVDDLKDFLLKNAVLDDPNEGQQQQQHLPKQLKQRQAKKLQSQTSNLQPQQEQEKQPEIQLEIQPEEEQQQEKQEEKQPEENAQEEKQQQEDATPQ